MKAKTKKSKGGGRAKRSSKSILDKVVEPHLNPKEETSPANQGLPDHLDIQIWKDRFREAFRQEDLAWRLFECDMQTAATDPLWTLKSEHWRSFFQMRARRALAGLNGLLTKEWVAEGVMKDAEQFFGKPLTSIRGRPKNQIPRAAEAIRDLSLHAAVLLLRAGNLQPKTSDDQKAAEASKNSMAFLVKWHSLPHLRTERKNQRNSKRAGNQTRGYSHEFMDVVKTLIQDSVMEHSTFWQGRYVDPQEIKDGSYENCTPKAFGRPTPRGSFDDPEFQKAWLKWIQDMLNYQASKGKIDGDILRKRMPEIRKKVFPEIVKKFCW